MQQFLVETICFFNRKNLISTVEPGNTFVDCLHFKPPHWSRVQVCPPGTVFNRKINICDHAYNLAPNDECKDVLKPNLAPKADHVNNNNNGGHAQESDI